jgi:mitogen-activated protein kinase 1/3
LEDAKRVLREIKILCHCQHPNIIQILELHAPASIDFEDIYIQTELLDTDLGFVMFKSKQKVEEQHIKHFAFQMLRGIRYLHRAGVIHRDLKPQNILVNKDGEAKICDLGLARGLDSTNEDDDDKPKTPNSNVNKKRMTIVVATRWYRAPEVLFSSGEYSMQIDAWSIGVILGELHGRKILFKGRDEYKDQIQKIIDVMGTPTDPDLEYLDEKAEIRGVLKSSFEPAKKKVWKEVYPSATPAALSLIEGLITYNPNKRLTVDDALKSTWFADLQYEEDPVPKDKIDWTFDDFQPNDKRQLQNFLYLECAAFHPSILQRDETELESRGITREMRENIEPGQKGSHSSIKNRPLKQSEVRPDGRLSVVVRPEAKKEEGQGGCCVVM